MPGGRGGIIGGGVGGGGAGGGFGGGGMHMHGHYGAAAGDVNFRALFQVLCLLSDKFTWKYGRNGYKIAFCSRGNLLYMRICLVAYQNVLLGGILRL